MVVFLNSGVGTQTETKGELAGDQQEFVRGGYCTELCCASAGLHFGVVVVSEGGGPAMLWLAVVLAIVSVVSFVAGFVLFANGAGVAPHRRTSGDPTGVRRATARVAWPDLFRGMRRCLTVMRDESANHTDRLAAAGSLLVLTAIIAGFVALLAFLAALL